MGQKRLRVMEKLIAQCRQAYQARVPLIMVDTEEVELMRRLAREGNLVDLLKPITPADDRHDAPYYAYIGVQPDRLELCENFSQDLARLEEMANEGGRMSYRKPSGLFLLHLTQSAWQAKSTAAMSMVSCLRAYVDAYVSCGNVSSALRNSCVLLYGDPALLPKDLKPYTEVFAVEYPKTWEIMEIICEIAAENGYPFEKPEYARDIALQMTGFPLMQVEKYVRRLLWVDSESGKPLLFEEGREELLLDAKSQSIESSGGLLKLYRERKDDSDQVSQLTKTVSEQEQHADDLGGMKAYKRWVDEAGARMEKNGQHTYALERGVPALKGVLLCGVPGCGKSEAAKILHRKWNTPMVRMDMDQLMGGLVGDSERNLRQALAQAEAMAPCILWIDELEKGFSAATSGSGDGGTFKRMFGRLLTWMQENTKPCFIFATANDISGLPSEFFRSGRFDALFAVYMPTNDECKEIFKEQMYRAERLRQKTAEEQGTAGELPPLFHNDSVMGCFTDSALQKIMDLIMEDKDAEHPEGIKFLSGADIQKITTNALVRIPQEKLGAPIDLSTWLTALRAVIRDSAITTLGSSSANLDKIAACYVRLMRENFAPVSDVSQLLFHKEYYTRHITENKQVIVKYSEPCYLQQDYDRALFYALRGRIELIAPQVETNALRRLGE